MWKNGGKQEKINIVNIDNLAIKRLNILWHNSGMDKKRKQLKKMIYEYIRKKKQKETLPHYIIP